MGLALEHPIRHMQEVWTTPKLLQASNQGALDGKGPETKGRKSLPEGMKWLVAAQSVVNWPLRWLVEDGEARLVIDSGQRLTRKQLATGTGDQRAEGQLRPRQEALGESCKSTDGA
jgi:hypothetical protein